MNDLPHKDEVLRKKTWDTFRETGQLWLVNRSLHLFGWAIVVEVDDTTHAVTGAYPARVKWRGFSPASEEQGFRRVTAFMKDAVKDLLVDLDALESKGD
jgi:hypothetical protein